MIRSFNFKNDIQNWKTLNNKIEWEKIQRRTIGQQEEIVLILGSLVWLLSRNERNSGRTRLKY